MSVLARFYVSTVTRRAFNPDHAEIELQAVSRGTENKTWAQYTPSGEIKLTINNPSAAQFFADRLGKDVTLTFDAADDDTAYQSPHQQPVAPVA